MKTRSQFFSLLSILLILEIMLLGLSCEAALQVFPTRLLITDRTNAKSGSLTLLHKGDHTAKYRISIVFFKLGADGKYEQAKDPLAEVQTLAPHLKYSPREITLQPDVKQVVRVMVKPPGDMLQGDYRAHLHFETEDDDVSMGNSNLADDSKLQLNLKARVAVAIPIIYRHGSPSPSGSLTFSKFKLLQQEDQSLTFQVDSKKEGNSFFYGELRVTLTNADGKTAELTPFKGVSIYNANQTLRFPIKSDETWIQTATQAKIDFIDAKDDQKGRNLASLEQAISKVELFKIEKGRESAPLPKSLKKKTD